MLFTSYSGRLYSYNPYDSVVSRCESESEAPETYGFDRVVAPVTVDLIRAATRGHMTSLTLCATESCNFRCAYCVYSGAFPGMRSHSSRSMSLSTAYAAVDFFLARSTSTPRPVLSFFGGEPLLRFNDVKSIVAYAERRRVGEIGFTISSNGSLVSDEVVDFLDERPNVQLFVTVNGGPETHDRLRVLSTGVGSHGAIMSRMRRLRERLGESRFNEQVSFLANYANPYELIDMERWYDSEGIETVNYTPISPPLDERVKRRLGVLSEEEERIAYRRVLRYFVDESAERGRLCSFLRSGSTLTSLVHYRRQSAASVLVAERFCAPFHRRAFVDANGRIYVCERAERTPSYGDVNSGAIDYQRLERDLAFVQYVVDEVVECRRCFAARFCQLCWVVFLRERVLQVREQPDAIAREMASACRAMRRAFRREMSLYAYLCERAPELLDEFAPPDAEAHDAIATQQLRALDSLVGVRSPNVPSTETREV